MRVRGEAVGISRILNVAQKAGAGRQVPLLVAVTEASAACQGVLEHAVAVAPLAGEVVAGIVDALASQTPRPGQGFDSGDDLKQHSSSRITDQQR